jgi:uncharacterized protein (DUF1501 family)
VFDLQSVSRRRFLKGSAVTVGAAAVAPYLRRLEAFAAPPVADNQGILVTVYLGGGNDGLNTVAPVADAAYAALRPNLQIAGGHSIGGGLALHPSFTNLKTRFDQGKVAVVRGVGYQPPDLSHFSSGDIWDHGWGGAGTPATGWLGRFLDGLPNTAHESLYGVSLHGGVGPQLVGAASQASTLPLSIQDAFGINRSDPSDARMYDALIAHGNGASGLGGLGDFYDSTEMDLMLLAQRIAPAYDFPDQPNDLATQLVLAAHLINANFGIRVIDTQIDGFDTHSDQADWHGTLLSRLDTAIDAFFTTLAPRWQSQVVLMTFSEFGRRPEENGDVGTDHGTAAPIIVVGDHVKGGLHGAQPSLTSLDDDGNLVPAVDFRQVYASMLRTWLKADDSALLGHAYSPLSLFEAGPAAPFTGNELGYWLAGPKGVLHAFGLGTQFGGAANVGSPIVGGGSTPSHVGLWLATAEGRVYCFGDAQAHGGLAKHRLKTPVVGLAATPSGKGYWLVTAAGGVFAFGDAKSHGTLAGRHSATPVSGIAPTRSGKGYWLVNQSGAVFAFGDATSHGSAASRHLPKPVIDVCATPSGKGYWLVTSAGGVLGYGDAHEYGAGVSGSAPVVNMAATPSGKGYWLAASDGRVAAYGDAPKLGGTHGATAVLVRC